MSELLSNAEIDDALSSLPEWSLDGSSITRTVELPTFPAAIQFVSRVATAAEAAGHHPDIDIRWRKLTFTLSTHSEGGLTSKDVDLAREIENLLIRD
ncbi:MULTISPECIES: 4a-hydroxytetrahydrobiopterin dehydratase [unclassified Rhodococcus (in: high G+C Gram-positive bacteria)]|uniref:4a-hydroxytetrahydrobiopterin dehydratase n=1 Tax=unclassified Rhodococcus (in: high G+C Gram-positive bacteria) TaxID=192944 RepID=UPI00109D9A0E|nr:MULTISPECIES: 4a-hydroxytetrahydrobiopterin dehydratase [unclassified Rhodococcus (in: high G+C Gram-positive bacteria)]QCB52252.1 4a-hydroxytetrahydrobiopterin dehydratase [Rhodococcus sp. PAMC28705]QCB59578.1 4a-hydroxytetrahydrobiopterin dehydratase [Rhodococcus sp. PAMC28707]